MSQQPCSNCPTLARIIRKQQQEIARLERIIASAKYACAVTIAKSDKVLTGNQPRGTWSYARGAKETAQDIVKKLGRVLS